MKFYSPLRYPGGKSKVSKFVSQVIIKNDLSNGTYVEPYAGGASVALSLVIEGKVQKVIINDYDRSIYAFWYSVLHHTDEICKKISRTPVTINVWRRQKEVQKNKTTVNLLDLGFSTFFLNRANRSGIIDGGPIGGLKQEGEWKIDARFNKQELISRIRLIAEYKENIKLYNSDAVELMKALAKKLPEKTLVYLDPPYYVKGKDLYVNYYDHDDHLLVAKTIRGIPDISWIVSYDRVRPITKMYKNYKKRIYEFRYTAVHGNEGKEVMFFSKNLKVPTNVLQ